MPSTTYLPTRSIMDADELSAAHVADYGRDYRYSTDGYGDMAVANGKGWHVISCWGRDGWDLGDWPYVFVATRRTGRFLPTNHHVHGRTWQLTTTCEGDSTVYAFASEADRDAAIDYLFVWYGLPSATRYGGPWAGLSEADRSALDAGTLAVPLELRGPYRG